MSTTNNPQCGKELKFYLLWLKKKWDQMHNHINPPPSWAEIDQTIRTAYDNDPDLTAWRTDDEEEDPPNPLPCYRDFETEDSTSAVDTSDAEVGRLITNPFTVRMDCRVKDMEGCITGTHGLDYGEVTNESIRVTLTINSFILNPVDVGEPTGRLYFELLDSSTWQPEIGEGANVRSQS